MFAAEFWHHHYGKITAVWTAAFLLPFAAAFGAAEAVHQVVHALLLEYLPFVILLFSLYTIAGGICVRGTLVGTPATNYALLAIGAAARQRHGHHRRGDAADSAAAGAPTRDAAHRVHVVVFFIILVGNIGGALTPLGDPPLFIGFLKGVDFFWTTRRARRADAGAVGGAAGALLRGRYVLRRERPQCRLPAVARAAAVDGASTCCSSSAWWRGAAVRVLEARHHLRHRRHAARVSERGARRRAGGVGAALSLSGRHASLREANAFNWGPIVEVTKLFAGIFLTVIPVIVMLQSGQRGALAGVVERWSPTPGGAPRYLMYFWTTGILSAFLDNAPTYLVFFNLAGGDATTLMGPLAQTLAMISAGAVYFGALTYVGNAPNFMVKAIAESRGVPMPTFFAYFAIASVILLPMFVLMSLAYR